MRFIKSDGGRQYSAYYDERNDCTIIAIVEAFNVPYSEAYRTLKSLGRRKNCGFWISSCHRRGTINGKIMTEITHYKNLFGRTLSYFLDHYKKGTYILCFSEHTLTVVNGVYYGPVPLLEGRLKIIRAFRIGRDNNAARNAHKSKGHPEINLSRDGRAQSESIQGRAKAR